MIRGSISLLIVGLISAVMLLVVWPGPRAFAGYLPERVVALLESGPMSQVVGVVGGDTAKSLPIDYLADGPDGLLAEGPIAALEGNRPVFTADVINGYEAAITKAIPAEITMIRPITGCRLTPPLKGSLVGHVTAGVSGLDLPMVTYDDQVLAGAVRDFVATYRETGVASVKPVPETAFQAYDVAVTETSRPVYLVLVNKTGHRLWNIHLSPGARIERVVLLAGDHAGIANLDPVVPVEVISAKGLADCGIWPSYVPNPGSQIFAALNGADKAQKAEAERTLADLTDQAAAWNTWFRDSFGIPANGTRAGFDRGTLSVVGPIPGEADPKAVYAPIQGSRIRMTQDRYFEITGQVPEAESFAGRVTAIATSFAFGNLTYLRQGVAF